MQMESLEQGGKKEAPHWAAVGPGNTPVENPPRAPVESPDPAEDARLDQLPFSDSVRILSEAMKARVKRMAAGEGHPLPAHESDPEAVPPAATSASSPRKAEESLSDLLEALKSALDQAGLDKGSQGTLTRILGDLRNSVQYQAKGQGAVKTGPNSSLLNLSA